MNKHLLIASLILLSLNTLAQEPLMWQLTEEDGLPGNTVYQVLQDSDGYIWLGTDNGICRYDGKEIITYDSPLLLDKEILLIRQDSYSRIWFRNLASQLFYIAEGDIREFKFEQDLEVRFFDFFGDSIYLNMVFYENDKRIGNYRAINSIKDKLERTHSLDNSNRIGYSIFFAIYKDETTIIYPFFDDIKSCFYVTDDKVARELCLNIEHKKLLEGHIYILDYSDTSLIYTTTNTVSKSTSIKDTILHRFKSFNIEFGTAIDENHVFCTTKGVLFMDRETYTIKQRLLTDYSTNTVIKDKEGNYWIGTKKEGVIIMPNIKQELFNARNSILSESKINTLYRNIQGDILVGAENGHLSILNDTKIVENYKYNFEGQWYNIVLDDKNYWCTKENGNILAVSKDFKDSKDIYISNSSTKYLINAKSNELWEGNIGGLGKFKKATSSDENFQLLLQKYFRSHRTYALHYDSLAEKIWQGTVKGLYYYSYAQDSLLAHEEDGVHREENISYIIQIPDTSLWIATEGDGVYQLKNGKTVVRYNVENGLRCNKINELRYQFPYLWIASACGLHRLNTETQEIVVFDKTDGFPSNQITSLTFSDSHILWVGTPKGLLRLDTEELTINESPPPVHLTAFKIHDKDTVLQENYDLTYEQDNITIEYVGLGYRCRGDMTYRYRLLGLDSTWRETKEGEVRYPILNAGAYTFEVLAVNEDGTASITSVFVSFEIHPAFWQTLWFQLGSTSLIFLIIGSVVYVRLQRKRQRENLEKETQLKMNELRMSALQSQVNPHFIFNALNSIQHYLSENDRTKAMDYLARFAKMIRSIFEQSKEKMISLQEEISFLNLYLDLEKLRFSNKVVVDLGISPELESLEYSIKLPPLLIQPILENAFKHGLFHKKGMGHLRIYFELYEKAYLKCTVEDDGVGRKQAASLGWQQQKNHQSSGVGFTEERLNIHNGTGSKGLEITDLTENGKSKGTKVELYIRIGAQTKINE